MRGTNRNQSTAFSHVSPEKRVPSDHPLRAIRAMVDPALGRLHRKFTPLYSSTGRPSIPPEQLLRALVLQVLCSVRSERLLQGEIAEAFLPAVLEQAGEQKLLSDAHFTVDGTLLEAWAGHKSFRPKDPKAPGSGESGRQERERDFHGEPRRNDTHASTTDPEARLCDKGYDTQTFVAATRKLGFTPHVAQNTTNRRSAIDGRTTTHPGYALSQRRRKIVEPIFGWMKMIGPMRKLKQRSRRRVGWVFTFTAATSNLVRMRRLIWAT
jgi:transposase